MDNDVRRGMGNKICKVTINTPDNAECETQGGNKTQDKVFLLCIDEAKELLEYDVTDVCQPTEYAKSKGADIEDGYCNWWLRSPGNYQFYAAYITYSGCVDELGSAVDAFGDNANLIADGLDPDIEVVYCAVRPAMLINL